MVLCQRGDRDVPAHRVDHGVGQRGDRDVRRRAAVLARRDDDVVIVVRSLRMRADVGGGVGHLEVDVVELLEQRRLVVLVGVVGRALRREVLAGVGIALRVLEGAVVDARGLLADKRGVAGSPPVRGSSRCRRG